MYYWAIAESVCLLGASAARPIFERAIAQKDAHTVEFCMAYAQMEQELGCIDRARGLYVHASQFANPATHEEFWTMWKTWELEFGSEESYKEMKRRERAIQVMYSDKHFNTLDAGMESWRIETMQSIEVLPETPAPGIDISKLKQMAAQRKNTNAYIASANFQGTKPGYVFTSGPQGVGYYQDSFCNSRVALYIAPRCVF